MIDDKVLRRVRKTVRQSKRRENTILDVDGQAIRPSKDRVPRNSLDSSARSDVSSNSYSGHREPRRPRRGRRPGKSVNPESTVTTKNTTSGGRSKSTDPKKKFKLSSLVPRRLRSCSPTNGGANCGRDRKTSGKRLRKPRYFNRDSLTVKMSDTSDQSFQPEDDRRNPEDSSRNYQSEPFVLPGSPRKLD